MARELQISPRFILDPPKTTKVIQLLMEKKCHYTHPPVFSTMNVFVAVLGSFFGLKVGQL